MSDLRTELPNDAPVGDAAHIEVNDLYGSIWFRLGEHFGMVSLRPKLVPGTRIRREGGDIHLVHPSLGRIVDLAEEDLKLVRQFNGDLTIAELIVSGIGSDHRMSIAPVLGLVDRLIRAEMLADYPPNMFRQLDTHLERIAVNAVPVGRPLNAVELPDGEIPSPIAVDDPVSQFERVPWRPKTPLLAERAHFLRSVELLKDVGLVAIGQLAECVHEEAFPAATNVITEGTVAERFFIIRSGEANVLKRDEHGERKRVARLKPGDWFGEVGLLDADLRSATVRSSPSRPLICYSFDPITLERIISPYVSSFRGRQQVAKRRLRLEEIPLFEGLSRAEIERLAQVVVEHRVPEHTVVVRQGEEGDRFFIVVEGLVRIVRDGLPIADLGPGQFFGETALLFTSKRTASVQTAEDTILWSLDRVAFERMVRGTLMSRRDMIPMVFNRLQR